MLRNHGEERKQRLRNIGEDFLNQVYREICNEINPNHLVSEFKEKLAEVAGRSGYLDDVLAELFTISCVHRSREQAFSLHLFAYRSLETFIVNSLQNIPVKILIKSAFEKSPNGWTERMCIIFSGFDFEPYQQRFTVKELQESAFMQTNSGITERMILYCAGNAQLSLSYNQRFSRQQLLETAYLLTDNGISEPAVFLERHDVDICVQYCQLFACNDIKRFKLRVSPEKLTAIADSFIRMEKQDYALILLEQAMTSKVQASNSEDIYRYIFLKGLKNALDEPKGYKTDLNSGDDNSNESLSLISNISSNTKSPLPSAPPAQFIEPAENITLLSAVQENLTKEALGILAKGDKLNKNDKSLQGYTALHWAAYHDNTELVEALIIKGFSLTSTDANNHTPIEVAVDNNAWAVIFLFAKYKPANEDEAHYCTAMLELARKKQFILAEELFTQGVMHNVGLHRKYLPIHWAVTYNSQELLKLLLTQKIDLFLTNSEGLTAIELAAKLKQVSFIHQMIKTTPTILHQAVQKNKPHVITCLLANGVDKAITDAKGSTAMEVAATKGGFQCIECFTAFPTDKEDSACYGFGVLRAAYENKPVLAEKLLLAGAQPHSYTNTKNNWGALHYAVHNNHPRLAELLIKAGCDPGQGNEKHISPQMLFQNNLDRFTEPRKMATILQLDFKLISMDNFNNKGQNTHEKEVEVTVKNSIANLKKRYPNIDEASNLKAVESFIKGLPDNHQHKEKALQCFKRIKKNLFVVSRAKATLKYVLALVWEGVVDASAKPEDVKSLDESYIAIRKESLIEKLFEAETAYGNSSACVGGTLNKIVVSLNHAHPDVIVIMDKHNIMSIAVGIVPAWANELFSVKPFQECIAIVESWDDASDKAAASVFRRSIVKPLSMRLKSSFYPLLTNVQHKEILDSIEYLPCPNINSIELGRDLKKEIMNLYVPLLRHDPFSSKCMAVKTVKEEFEKVFSKKGKSLKTLNDIKSMWDSFKALDAEVCSVDSHLNLKKSNDSVETWLFKKITSIAHACYLTNPENFDKALQELQYKHQDFKMLYKHYVVLTQAIKALRKSKLSFESLFDEVESAVTKNCYLYLNGETSAAEAVVLINTFLRRLISEQKKIMSATASSFFNKNPERFQQIVILHNLLTHVSPFAVTIDDKYYASLLTENKFHRNGIMYSSAKFAVELDFSKGYGEKISDYIAYYHAVAKPFYIEAIATNSLYSLVDGKLYCPPMPAENTIARKLTLTFIASRNAYLGLGVWTGVTSNNLSSEDTAIFKKVYGLAKKDAHRFNSAVLGVTMRDIKKEIPSLHM